MPASTEARLAHAEARIEALQHLLIAAVVSANQRLPGSAAATTRIANALGGFSADWADAAAAHQTEQLLDHLRTALALPVND